MHTQSPVNTENRKVIMIMTLYFVLHPLNLIISIRFVITINILLVIWVVVSPRCHGSGAAVVLLHGSAA